MTFRSHVGRSLDMRLASNRLILGLTLVTALAAGAVMVTGGITDVWVAPAHTFLTWALVREVDPDHDWTALAAGFAAGLWVVTGQEAMSALALLGTMLAARLVLNSTGRRPLNTDLVGLVVIASGIAFTPEGWIAGFGLALAIYIDDRLREETRTASVIAAALAALGASAVATLTDAIPRSLPEFRPGLILVIGLAGLVAIMRDPVDPMSVTDSRDHRLLETSRLHAARGLVAVLLFIGAQLMGPQAIGLIPAVAGFILALLVNERDRLVRTAG